VKPDTMRYLGYGVMAAVACILLSQSRSGAWVKGAAAKQALLSLSISMLILVFLAVLWDLLVRIPREAAAEGVEVARRAEIQRQTIQQQLQVPSPKPEDFRTLIVVLPFPVPGGDFSEDPAVQAAVDRQRQDDGTPSALISSIAICGATPDAQVFMVVLEAAKQEVSTRKLLWKGEIGTLDTKELPAGDISSPQYRTAVEAQIRALAEVALG
jgi:hypothetical protein